MLQAVLRCRRKELFSRADDSSQHDYEFRQAYNERDRISSKQRPRRYAKFPSQTIPQEKQKSIPEHPAFSFNNVLLQPLSVRKAKDQ